MSRQDESDVFQTQFAMPPSGDSRARVDPLPVLVVLRGAEVGRRYLLNEDALVVGRDPERADLVVSGDRQISGVHCRIERGSAAGWVLTDLGSRNGTRVGLRKVESADLHGGDRIHIGQTVLAFGFHDEIEADFHQQVDQLMNVDDLTGLPVQRVFRQRCDQGLIFCERRSQPAAVMMMDMDGLKGINDVHGHAMGAHVIAVVGRRLGAIADAAGGVVSRFGGDEFSAFVPAIDRAAAWSMGERFRAAVSEEPIEWGGAVVRPTLSVGLAVFPDDGEAADALMRQADAALYRAKAGGRNRVSE